jgi:hypothetical protein
MRLLHCNLAAALELVWEQLRVAGEDVRRKRVIRGHGFLEFVMLGSVVHEERDARAVEFRVVDDIIAGVLRTLVLLASGREVGEVRHGRGRLQVVGAQAVSEAAKHRQCLEARCVHHTKPG